MNIVPLATSTVGFELGLADGLELTDGLALTDGLELTEKNSISQLVRLPPSMAPLTSRMASVQLPDGLVYNSSKLAASDTYPVGPTFVVAVAMNVPVKGGTPVLNAAVP